MQRIFVFLAAVVLGFVAIAGNLLAQDAAEYIMHARAFIDANERDKAIAECDRALTLDPKTAEDYNARGEAWAIKGNSDKAIAGFDKALAINPKFGKAYGFRGDAWTNKGEYDKAMVDSNQAIALDPKFAEAYFVRGFVWWHKGKIDKAVADFNRALAIKPDNSIFLNNLGVLLWKQAQEQDSRGAMAAAQSDTATANVCHQKSIALKSEAMAKWMRGVAVNPKAADMHSNLGYAYSEANDLDPAERHLTEAVRLKPDSARANNNLGRVLLRGSQLRDLEAREADAKGKTDFAEAAKARQLSEESQEKHNSAIVKFEKAKKLDPYLLEARLNLGEVFIQQFGVDTAKEHFYVAEQDLDRAELEFQEILKLNSENVKDRETINNFSNACFGLARIALARKKPDAALGFLRHAIALNAQNATAMQALARELFLRGEFGEGERALACLLAMMPKVQRPILAKQFGEQLETDGNHKEAVAAWNFLAWTFATSPDPNILDPASAMAVADRVVERTKQQNPLSLDALAAAQAASGHYEQAVKTAQTAIELSNAQHNKLLAEAIARRVPVYQQEKPYRSDPTGNDRP